MMVEYTIAAGWTTEGLATNVTQLCRDGWRPFGSVFYTVDDDGRDLFHQPMTRQSVVAEGTK
jgi:hypothetical protein